MTAPMRHRVRQDRFPRKAKKILGKWLFSDDLLVYYIDEMGYPTTQSKTLIYWKGRRLYYGHRHVLDCLR